MKPEISALVERKNNLPREARKTLDTTFDRIYKYYHNDKSRVELTKEEEVIRERWEKAWFLLCRHRTKKQVADILVKLFGVSPSLAFDDARNAMMLFTDPQKDVSGAKRAIAETWAVNGANRCWKEGDMEGYYKFLKEYREINGISADSNSDAMDEFMKKMKPTTIVIVSDASLLKAEAAKLQEEITNDTEFEDVT